MPYTTYQEGSAMRLFRFVFVLTLFAVLLLAPATQASAASLFNEEGDATYNILKSEVQSDTLDAFNEIMGESGGEGGHGWMYFPYLYEIFDSIFVIGLAICWTVGPLIIALSKKNKGLQKFAWVYLIFLIPALLILIEYGVPYLYLGFT